MREKSPAHGNSLYSQTATDALWRVTQVSSTLADYHYGYDENGNRSFMQRAHQSGAPYELYQYDSLNQLSEVWTGADAADPEDLTDYEQHQAYDLDPLGNRLTLDADGAQTEYQPSNGQRLSNPMNRYEAVNGAELSYDDIGNLLSEGTSSYGYDVLNRQISLTTLDSSAEYVYDALGRRVAKIVDGVTTYYLYNAGYQVIEERDAADALQARYSYGSGIDEPLTMERGGSVYFYHRDGLGSVTELSDDSGNLVERYEYDVYGAPTIFDSNDTEQTESAIGNPYLFTGRRFDPESGNYYYRARIYSPELGRFLQTDPLGYVDGLNLYAYVGNNPVSWIDPLGYARSDYVVNSDGSVTFVGEGATISEAVNLFEELGYDNWQEGVERFADDYDAGDWWTEDGSWTGEDDASLIDKTLYPKGPPEDPTAAPPEFIEPEPPICEPEGPPAPHFPSGPWSRPPEEPSSPPLPDGPWERPPTEPCDPALGYDCAHQVKPGQSPFLTEKLQKEAELLKTINDCAQNPPRGWLHKNHPECLKDLQKCREEMERFADCLEAASNY